MSNKRIFFILLIAFSSSLIYAQKLPSKKKILQPMQLTNQYFMDKWTDPGKSIITTGSAQVISGQGRCIMKD
jgi:hypothetical protein